MSVVEGTQPSAKPPTCTEASQAEISEDLTKFCQEMISSISQESSSQVQAAVLKFIEEKDAQIKTNNPDSSKADRRQAILEMWKGMTQTERDDYCSSANVDECQEKSKKFKKLDKLASKIIEAN